MTLYGNTHRHYRNRLRRHRCQFYISPTDLKIHTIVRVAKIECQHLHKYWRRKQTSPVSIMHPDCLLAAQHSCFVAHHTRLVERWLTVQNEYITVTKVSIHFLVDSGGERVQTMPLNRPARTLLRRQKLVRNRSPLLKGKLVLVELNFTLLIT